MGSSESKSSSTAKGHPDWEVLAVLGCYLDPKSLAVASCVSRTWRECFCSDLIWQPICTSYSHYSPISNLKCTNPWVPYSHLYRMAYNSSQRRIKATPPKPQLSLDDLVFVITIRDANNEQSSILNKSTTGIELQHKGDLFRFNIELNNEPLLAKIDVENAKITWNVMLKGLAAAFTMMNRFEKIRLASIAGEWYSEELPLPARCSYNSHMMSSGITSDLQLAFCGESDDVIFNKKVFINKLSLGMFDTINSRYMTLDDGLRYLEHFLLY